MVVVLWPGGILNGDSLSKKRDIGKWRKKWDRLTKREKLVTGFSFRKLRDDKRILKVGGQRHWKTVSLKGGTGWTEDLQ